MIKNCWGLFLLPFFLNCATHAPMSEMVMFNKEPAEQANVKAEFAVSVIKEGIRDEDFEQKKLGDYGYGYEDFGIPNISLNGYIMQRDSLGFGMSLGRGTGADITLKIKNSYYVTGLITISGSGRVIVQNSVINTPTSGFAPGVFVGFNARGYSGACDYDCDGSYLIGPSETVVLFSAGLRGRYLIRSSTKPGVVITGAVEIGHLFEINRSFVGFNFSATSF